MIKMKVRNMRDYAYKYKYIVATKVGSDYWFYGAYNNDSKDSESMREALDEEVYNGDERCTRHAFSIESVESV